MSALQGLNGNDEGWIEWGGGECPVADDVVVVTKLRDFPHSSFPARAYDKDWSHLDDDAGQDIIAYRIHKES